MRDLPSNLFAGCFMVAMGLALPLVLMALMLRATWQWFNHRDQGTYDPYPTAKGPNA